MVNRYPGFAAPGRRAGRWLGAALLLGALACGPLASAFSNAPPAQDAPPTIGQFAYGLSHLPFYAACTVARMWTAFCLSLGFALLTGYAAAHSRKARALLLPAIDVLQSVPVFGYLVAAVSLFAGTGANRLAFELASVLAIFSSQAWNMSLSVYQSLSGLPEELRAVATVHRMRRWEKLRVLELPCAVQSLLWNSMLSFGSGWFFVIQSEAFSVLHQEIRLPGLGAYMAASLERADVSAVVWATLLMLLILLLTDQLLWRPLLAWADRFTLETTGAGEPPRSWMYHLLKNLRRPHTEAFDQKGQSRPPEETPPKRPEVAVSPQSGRAVLRGAFRTLAVLAGLLVALACVWSLYNALRGAADVLAQMRASLDTREWLRVLRMGAWTLLRVGATTVLATLLWVPLGIWMGRRPKVSRVMEPLAQMAAAFPANLTFPLIAGFFVRHRLSMDWGSILLLAMGAQWYILFNVSAGAASISGDLNEVARCYRLRGFSKWRTLLLPAVFPAWVTGACTAAGGAWNASVVAEMATWGSTTLRAEGLGSYLTTAAQSGDIPRLLAAILTMTGLVLLTNKLVWRPLFAVASRRFSPGN